MWRRLRTLIPRTPAAVASPERAMNSRSHSPAPDADVHDPVAPDPHRHCAHPPDPDQAAAPHTGADGHRGAGPDPDAGTGADDAPGRALRLQLPALARDEVEQDGGLLRGEAGRGDVALAHDGQIPGEHCLAGAPERQRGIDAGLPVPGHDHGQGRFPGETSCLSLCWAVLDIFIAGARGLGLSDLEYRQVVQLKGLRSRQQEEATQKTA